GNAPPRWRVGLTSDRLASSINVPTSLRRLQIQRGDGRASCLRRIEWQEMIASLVPVVQLIAVVRAARMSRLTLPIDCPQPRWNRAQIRDKTIARSRPRLEDLIRPGVADGRVVAADRNAAVIEQFTQVAAT